MMTNRYCQAVGCYDAIEAHKRYSPVDGLVSGMHPVGTGLGNRLQLGQREWLSGSTSPGTNDYPAYLFLQLGNIKGLGNIGCLRPLKKLPGIGTNHISGDKQHPLL